MINFLSKGGIKTDDADATPEDIISPKSAYVNGKKIVGSMIPSYIEAGDNINVIDGELIDSNYMTIGFSKDNQLAFQIDRTKKEMIVYENKKSTLVELKRESLIDVIQEELTWDLGPGSGIYCSAPGASESKDCIYVAICCYKDSSTHKTYISVFNLKTLEFNYTVNDYIGLYSIVLVNKVFFPNDNIPNMIFYKNKSGTQGYLQTAFLDKTEITQTKRIAGVVNSVRLYNISFCAQNKIFITTPLIGDYDSLYPRVLIYYQDTAAYAMTDNTVIINKNGQYAVDESSVYSCSIDHLNRSISKIKLFDFENKYYQVWFFITDSTFVAIPTTKKDFSTLILVTINYEEQTISEFVLNFEKPIDAGSITLNDALNIITSKIKTIEIQTTPTLDSLNRNGNNFFNTSKAGATPADILLKKVAYNRDGKVTGTMTNNGELTYTPSTEEQSIPEGYTSGGSISAVDSSIDTNILPENIKEGVTILGVTGTYTGETTPDQEVV